MAQCAPRLFGQKMKNICVHSKNEPSKDMTRPSHNFTDMAMTMPSSYTIVFRGRNVQHTNSLVRYVDLLNIANLNSLQHLALLKVHTSRLSQFKCLCRLPANKHETSSAGTLFCQGKTYNGTQDFQKKQQPGKTLQSVLSKRLEHLTNNGPTLSG